jgi:RNA polymerase sigma factor (TIGR02999 family)
MGTDEGRGSPEPQPLAALFPVLYDECRRLAGSRLRHERAGHSLRPTELVHEVFLRLETDRDLMVSGRIHFLAIAGKVMRRILVEHARRRQSDKRGGRLLRISLDDLPEVADPDRTIELLALDQALERLASVDAESAEVVEHRFFAGLTEVETASLMGRSERWARYRWTFARAWLRDALAE